MGIQLSEYYNENNITLSDTRVREMIVWYAIEVINDYLENDKPNQELAEMIRLCKGMPNDDPEKADYCRNILSIIEIEKDREE